MTICQALVALATPVMVGAHRGLGSEAVQSWVATAPFSQALIVAFIEITSWHSPALNGSQHALSNQDVRLELSYGQGSSAKEAEWNGVLG